MFHSGYNVQRRRSKVSINQLYAKLRYGLRSTSPETAEQFVSVALHNVRFTGDFISIVARRTRVDHFCSLS